jgi:hypothetical protein
MMRNIPLLSAVLLFPLLAAAWAEEQPAKNDAAWLQKQGELLFHDSFDRDETGNGLKGVGNGWESATADRVPQIKQADLDDGILKISSATKEAGHGIHLHHDAGFANGGVTLRFKFPGLNSGESLTVGFVDRQLKGVHAGHLCYAKLNPTSITLIDQKTGISDETIRKERQAFLDRKEKLPPELETLLKSKEKTVPWKADREWHELVLAAEGDELRLSLDGKLVCAHRSEGFAHPEKRWLSLAAPNTVWVDDVKIWKVRKE